MAKRKNSLEKYLYSHNPQNLCGSPHNFYLQFCIESSNFQISTFEDSALSIAKVLQVLHDLVSDIVRGRFRV